MTNWTDLKDCILSCCGNTSEEWTRGDAIGLSVCFIIAIIGLLIVVPMRVSEMSDNSDSSQVHTIQVSPEMLK